MAEVTPKPQRITVEDLMQFDEDLRIEIVDGIPVEFAYQGGLSHVIVIDNTYDCIKPYVVSCQLGWLHTYGVTFVLNQCEDGTVLHARTPDLFFLRADAMPADYDRDLPFPGAPTLAIEVVSPSERASDTQEKVSDYLQFGSEQVWVIYPRRQELHQYIAGKNVIRIYRADETLHVPSLFPDLKIKLSDLFSTEP